MEETKLSENFTLREMTRSSAAETYHLDNTPDEKATKNLEILCKEVLQPARNLLKRPLIINSGYRSKEVNARVGGAKNSYHLTGCAADIHADNTAEGAVVSAALLANELTDLVILEKRGRKVWVHAQWSYSPRHKYMQDFR